MEDGKKLIPYSVHLPEHVYRALKEQAKSRKASSMVRDAITMILEGEDSYNSGYKKAIRDTLNIIRANTSANDIQYQGVRIADQLADEIAELAP